MLRENNRTALVLIEFQNDFASAGGMLHAPVAPVMKATGMLERTVELVAKARKAGVMIIHLPITIGEEQTAGAAESYGVLRDVALSGAFRKGTWGADFVDALRPAPEDIVVEGKRGLCCFSNTDLDMVLRSLNIRTLALGGFLTNCCVESTMRTAYELGYQVITLTDCCAAMGTAEHTNAVELNFPLCSEPMTAEQFSTAIGAQRAKSLRKRWKYARTT